MSTRNVEDTARYDTAAADIYAAFHAMPNSSSVVDGWNAMAAVRQAVRGRSAARVVDLGCGAGSRTREIAALPEVAFALGVDRSREQLALARTATIPDNCHFALGDLVALGNGGDAEFSELLGTFDVALMEFVTSHAGTQDDLDAMIRTAAAFLAPGGSLVAVEGNPRLDRAPFPASDQYAVAKTFLLSQSDSSGVVPAFTKIRTTFITPAGELSVEDYFHDVQSWSTAVDRAGLVDLDIHDFVAPPDSDAGFWEAYLRPGHPSRCAHAAVISAAKPVIGPDGSAAG